MPMGYAPQDFYGALRVQPDTTSEAKGIESFGKSIAGAMNTSSEWGHEGDMLNQRQAFAMDQQHDQQAFTAGRDESNQAFELKKFGLENDARKAAKEAAMQEKLGNYAGVAGALLQQGALTPDQLAYAHALPPAEQEGALQHLIDFGGYKIKEQAKADIHAAAAGDPTDVRSVPIEGTDYVIPFAGNKAMGTLPVHKDDSLKRMKSFGKDASGNPIVGYPYFQGPTGQVGFQRVDVSGGATAAAKGVKRVIKSIPGPTVKDPVTGKEVAGPRVPVSVDPSTGKYLQLTPEQIANGEAGDVSQWTDSKYKNSEGDDDAQPSGPIWKSYLNQNAK